MGDAKQPSYAQQLMAGGVGRSLAYMIAQGRRALTLEMAARVHDRTGRQFGPLEGASASEVAALKALVKRQEQAAA